VSAPAPGLARGVLLMSAGALQRAECELTKAARELRHLGRPDLAGQIHDLRRRTSELVSQLRSEPEAAPHPQELPHG
jgi:hypothetical protein